MTLEADGALVGVIGDEDTVTGFVLAGVGDVDESLAVANALLTTEEMPGRVPTPLVPDYL